MTSTYNSSFPNGVASGDVTQNSAVLWTRSEVLGEVTFEYSTDPNFNEIAGTLTTTVTDPTIPVKVELTDLAPGTQYYYRVINSAGETLQGNFPTSAEAGVYAGLQFGVSGDWRGELAPYPAINNATEQDLDFFVEHGDTIYADIGSPAVLNPDGSRKEQAQTLSEYRAKHNEVYSERFGLNTWADLRAVTPILATIDDHEVTNDFAGGAPASSDERFPETEGLINDTQLFENGLQTFQEYNPLRNDFYGETGYERSDGERKLYRFNTYGNDAALMVLDTRTFRDEAIEPPANFTNPEEVAAVLTETLTRDITLLGETQLSDLKQDLLAADEAGITWKFVMVPEPIQNIFPGINTDAFEGYGKERAEILKFITENDINNVVFVAADVHTTFVNNVTYQEVPFGEQIPTNVFEITTGAVAFDAPTGEFLGNLFVSGNPELEAFYNSLPIAPDTDDLPNDKDDFVKQAVNDQLLTPLGFDPLGLNNNLPQAEGLIDAELIQGDYFVGHSYGWTQFDINPETQQLTVTTYGIEAYTEEELLASTEEIINREPQIVSQFVVNPQPPEPLDILLVNDDGYQAEGINILYEELTAAGYNVTFVAPKEQQSGTGTFINADKIFQPTEVVNFEENKWYVDASPTVTTWAGLDYILAENEPDLVISGINEGENVGSNVAISSGTVSAASAAIQRGIPAIAVSAGVGSDETELNQAYNIGAEFIVDLVEQLENSSPELLPEGVGLNVNIPANFAEGVEGIQGVAFTQLDEVGTIDFGIGELPPSFGEGVGFTVSIADKITPDQIVNPQSEGERFLSGFITVSPIDGDWTASEFVRQNLSERLENAPENATATPLDILITNDDGFDAEGIQVLYENLTAAGHNVTLVAPKEQQSGTGTLINVDQIFQPAEIVNFAPNQWYVNGSPRVTTWTGLDYILDEKPDLVISGINEGENIGPGGAVSSGTVSAAVTGLLRDVPAIAISAGIDFVDETKTSQAYQIGADYVVDLIAQLQATQGFSNSILPEGIGLNINIPVRFPEGIEEIQGVKITESDEISPFDIRFGELPDGGAGLQFSPAELPADTEINPLSEGGQFLSGFITVTPLNGDWNAEEQQRQAVRDLISPTIATPKPELVGLASLPADTFAPGPESGADVSSDERTGPFPGQPVGGWSGVQFADEDSFWFIVDSLFGSNSDTLARIYKVFPNFAGIENGDGSVEIEDFITLSDPNNLIPFPIRNEADPQRPLTGTDFDTEALVIDANGDLWVGDEYGPYLLHFDPNGVLLQPPIPTPEITPAGLVEGEFVRSPDNPEVEAGEAEANLRGSRGFEGIAYSPDRSILYPILEAPVAGDPPNSLRIYQYDIAAGNYSPELVGLYPLDDPGDTPTFQLGDFTPINDREFLVIERDDFQADGAFFKKIFKVDISQVDENGFVKKEEVVDLLDIADPNDLNGDGNQSFDLPITSVEDVLVIDEKTILVSVDNNYPFGDFASGRPPELDNNEIILVELTEPLDLDPRLGVPVASSVIVGTDENDRLVGSQAGEIIAGLFGDDEIFGGDGDDILRGDLNRRFPGENLGGNDTIAGGSGNDRIGGKGGNDSLFGEEGDDSIWGDNGDDFIQGGLGNDTLTGDDFSGGEGSDTFVLVPGEGTDTFVDFEVGVDRIGLVNLTFSDLVLTAENGSTVIAFGDEILAILEGVETLSELNFSVL